MHSFHSLPPDNLGPGHPPNLAKSGPALQRDTTRKTVHRLKLNWKYQF